jgi:nitrogen regulatory protein PII
MKKIEAYIKRALLTETVEQLHLLEGLTGVSIIDIKGFGRTRDKGSGVHIADTPTGSAPHAKLEIMCRDELAHAVVETIRAAAHTGLRADGKIYVSAVESALRISTGEQGENAV